MGLLHVAEDLSSIAGGIPAVVRQLSEQLVNAGHSIDVLHSRGDPGKFSFRARTKALEFQHGWKTVLGYWELKHEFLHLLSSGAETLSRVHIHGIWSPMLNFAARQASARKVPFVVSAHGMLEPWLWNEQGSIKRAKKIAYWKLFAHPSFKTASVLHAITPLERKHLQNLFPENRIEVIPNAIEVASPHENEVRPAKREKIILFLGRIEPKKGVDLLLHAFSNANIGSEWRLVIIGPIWSRKYKNELEKIVANRSLGARVQFLPPAFGDEKSRWLRRAWIMAVPSHSEAIGLVNLEAASNLMPSITTYQTGLEDWDRAGGILVNPISTEIQGALEQACAWSEDEQINRGKALREYVYKNYSWSAVLPKWLSLYASLYR